MAPLQSLELATLVYGIGHATCHWHAVSAAPYGSVLCTQAITSTVGLLNTQDHVPGWMQWPHSTQCCTVVLAAMLALEGDSNASLMLALPVSITQPQ